MTRTLTILATLTACLLLNAAPAQGASWKIDRATKIAETVWNHCPGQLEIQFADPATRGLTEMSAGWADEDGCVINLNPNHRMMRHWETFCTEVIHETGHAARFRDPLNVEDPQHSHRTTSVMAANPTVVITNGRVLAASGKWTRSQSFAGTDPRCRDRGRPYLEAHGEL